MELVVTSIVAIFVALITSVFGPMLVEWVKHKFTKRPDPIGEAIHHNSIVDHQLDMIIDELQCNRVWIAMFHNGGHFYPTGKSIQKFSIFHERIKDGTSSIMDTFQNIPISLFPKTFAKLHESTEVYLHQTESFDLDVFSRNYDTESMYMFTIEDSEGRFIGTLAIEYNEKVELVKNDFIFIRQKLGMIGNILTNYLKATQQK